MATTKAQLQSKYESTLALLNAEIGAHNLTRRAVENEVQAHIATREALISELEAAHAATKKLDDEWKATVAGMRTRYAMQYRKLTNTSGANGGESENSVEARATVNANGFTRLEGESNAQYIQRIRKQQQPTTQN